MPYDYYAKITTDEHMLYASEIAKQYGFKTLNDDPHARLITAILDEFVKRTQITVQELYFMGNRPSRVYRRDLYHPAIVWFRRQRVENIKIGCRYRFPNGKAFNFKPFETCIHNAPHYNCPSCKHLI